MKALSFSQPWLWAIFDPTANKDIENRQWMPPIDMIGQPFACHAAKSFDDDGLTALWDLLLETPREYTKSAIIGVATIDRVVTCSRTLSPSQAQWFMGDPETGMLDGRQVYGLVLRDRKLLPRPIPWDGALGFWTLPPMIESEVQAQLAGSAYTPPYRIPFAKTLHDAGVATNQEWAEKHPGEHLYFVYEGLPSCVCCGKVQPKDTAKKPPKPCRGIATIGLR
jgi:hypothetical protein